LSAVSGGSSLERARAAPLAIRPRLRPHELCAKDRHAAARRTSRLSARLFAKSCGDFDSPIAAGARAFRPRRVLSAGDQALRLGTSGAMIETTTVAADNSFLPCMRGAPAQVRQSLSIRTRCAGIKMIPFHLADIASWPGGRPHASADSSFGRHKSGPHRSYQAIQSEIEGSQHAGRD